MDVEEKKLTVIDRRMEMSNVEKEAVDAQNPNAVILKAMDKNYSPELIEKMMDLQVKWEQNEARKAYHKAMSAFKANPPIIEKTKEVSFGAGKTSYFHAELADACEKINTALSPNGLHATWKTEQTNGNVTVYCTITHELGHSESTSLSAAPDTSGSKNAIQALGSTISYLERYTLFALTGLAAHGMDDDGKGSGNSEDDDDFISEVQLATLVKKVEQSKINEKAFLKSLGVETLSELPVSKFNKALIPLNARIKQNK